MGEGKEGEMSGGMGRLVCWSFGPALGILDVGSELGERGNVPAWCCDGR